MDLEQSLQTTIFCVDNPPRTQYSLKRRRNVRLIKPAFGATKVVFDTTALALAFEEWLARTHGAAPFFCLARRLTMPKKISVIQESDTGRNERFRDNYSGKEMTRNQFVREIHRGNYDNYHVRKINGIDTPVSNPDDSENNNLG